MVSAATAAGDGRLMWRLAGARLRSDWQYRISFFSFTIAQAFVTLLDFLTLVLLLELTPTLGGWTRAEVMLLYGLAATPFAASDLVVSAVEDVSEHVRDGTFDRMLLRPASTLVQLMGDGFALRRAGKLIPTSAALIWGLAAVDLDWNLGRVAIVIVAVATGFGIYSALWIGTAAITFWIVDSREALNSVTYGGRFANEYPLHLYRNWIRLLLGWVLPLAFVAYVPSIALVDPVNPLGIPTWLVWLNPLVAAATLAAALGLWGRGIRHYESTGS